MAHEKITIKKYRETFTLHVGDLCVVAREENWRSMSEIPDYPPHHIARVTRILGRADAPYVEVDRQMERSMSEASTPIQFNSNGELRGSSSSGFRPELFAYDEAAELVYAKRREEAEAARTLARRLSDALPYPRSAAELVWQNPELRADLAALLDKIEAKKK